MLIEFLLFQQRHSAARACRSGVWVRRRQGHLDPPVDGGCRGACAEGPASACVVSRIRRFIARLRAACMDSRCRAEVRGARQVESAHRRGIPHGEGRDSLPAARPARAKRQRAVTLRAQGVDIVAWPPGETAA